MAAALSVNTLKMIPRKNWHLVEQTPLEVMYCMLALLKEIIPLRSRAKQVVMTQEEEAKGFTILVQRQRNYLPRTVYHGLGKGTNIMVLTRVT